MCLNFSIDTYAAELRAETLKKKILLGQSELWLELFSFYGIVPREGEIACALLPPKAARAW